MAELFLTFSSESQKLRFFGMKEQLNHQTLSLYSNIDYDREIAIVAEIMEDGRKRIIGDVRIFSDPLHEKAQLAIIIGDPWQKLGIGSKLLDYALTVAKKEEVASIYSIMLNEHCILSNMLKKRKFKIIREENHIRAELEISK